MTTNFSSKEEALNKCIFCARGDTDRCTLKRIPNKFISQYGNRIDGSEVYQVVNSKGVSVEIAVSPNEENKWDSWLSIPEIGIAVRL